MSNLGLYQTITTTAAKVGGVRNLIGLILSTGAAAGAVIGGAGGWFLRGRRDKAKGIEAGKITRGVLVESISDDQSVAIDEGTPVMVLQTEDPEVVLVEVEGMDNPIALRRDDVHLSQEE